MVVLQPIKPGPPRVSLSLKRGRARRALSLLGNNNSRQNLQLAESLLTISAEEFTNKWNFDPIQGVPLPSGRFQWTPLTTVTSSDPTTVTSSDASDISTSSVDVPNPAVEKSQDQTTCVTLPPPNVTCQVSSGQPSDLSKAVETEAVSATSDSATHNCCPRTCACSSSSESAKNTDKMRSDKDNQKASTNTTKIEADSGIDSDDSVVDETESTFADSSSKTDTLQASKLRQTCITEFVRPNKLSTFTPPEPLHHSTYSKKRPASTSLQDQLNQPPHKKVLLHLRA